MEGEVDGASVKRSRGRRLAVQLCLTTVFAGAAAVLMAAYACAGQDTTCGNGVLDPGEECDDGNRSNEDGCTALCRRSVCGDGITDRSREQCDDRNTEPGDGCDALCRREGMVCGNGVLEDVGSWPEECDDGNTVDGDGCSSNCFNEVGECGDGTVNWNEECDDGNRVPGDGCDEDCQQETPDGGGDADADVEAVDGDVEARDGDVEGRDGEFGEGSEDGEAGEGAEDADVIEARDGWECSNPICDLAPQCGCESGTKCTLVGAERSCARTGFLSEGRACTDDSECAAGLYCAPAVATDVLLCHRFCATDAECLGAGSRCLVPVFGGPTGTLATLCTVNCDLESGSGCPEGTRCKIFDDGEGTFLTDCSGNVGDGRLGHACTGEADCASGFFCASPSYPSCLQYCVYPDGYCEGGYVCRAFAEPVMIGSRQYGYCG
jgi:cysteine-rich repeat protein